MRALLFLFPHHRATFAEALLLWDCKAAAMALASAVERVSFERQGKMTVPMAVKYRYMTTAKTWTSAKSRAHASPISYNSSGPG